MAYVMDRIPFTIPVSTSVSQAIDIEGNGAIVGIIVATQTPNVWTAAKIVFSGYVPDSGHRDQGNEWQDPSAVYLPLLNDSGAVLAFGDGVNTGEQYIVIGATTASPRQLDAARFVKINSGTVAGSAFTPKNQLQTVTGYLMVRRIP